MVHGLLFGLILFVLIYFLLEKTGGGEITQQKLREKLREGRRNGQNSDGAALPLDPRWHIFPQHGSEIFWPHSFTLGGAGTTSFICIYSL